MHVQIACMLCSIDPGTANMLMPIAQATIISAPILLRDQIRQGVRYVRGRGLDEIDAEDGGLETEDAPAGELPASEPTDQ
jgi:hypothetical protein